MTLADYATTSNRASCMNASLQGIINLNKPVGITSAKALYRVRSITKQRKSGHTGTLDLRATGVLVLCLGKATKLVERVMDLPKVYRATARLDATSAGFDSEGPLTEVTVTTQPSADRVLEACREFEGDIEQVPPTLSAIKIAGQPAYKRHRRNEPMTMKSRKVRIDWIHVHEYQWPYLDFEMCCGRGTYVRALIRDLGERLGTGGCLTSLSRLQVGPFTVTDAWTLADLEAAGDSSEFLLDLERVKQRLDTALESRPKRPLG